MKILDTLVMNGPNYWSNYRKKLIAMKIDLEKYENFSTNLLPGFNDSLKQLLPSLYDHHCSKEIPGGFFQRLEEGTWLGHVIEHIALEIQYLAGMACVFGRTYETDITGVYHVIFSYQIKEAGLYAGEAAFNLVACLAAGKSYTHLEQDIQHLKNLYATETFGPSTRSIVEEAKKRGIPISYLDNIISFGQGVYQKKIWATMTSQTSGLGSDIVTDKNLTKKLLRRHYLPVPPGVVVRNLQELDEALNTIGYPMVTKPMDSNHGKGVMTNIETREKAILGFKLAAEISAKVIVEKHIFGDDFRFLVINYKVVGVARRRAPAIIGDSVHTIQELIQILNQDPKRGKDHENFLTKVKIDESTHYILADKNLTLHSVLAKGESLVLKHSNNLSVGGTATDVTESVHPINIAIAERAARLVNLDVCGVDVVTEDIGVPLYQNNGAILEINASPGFRMHLNPCQGQPINAAVPVMDMLFPPQSLSRIPVVAVTGTNGKTTVVRLMSYLAKYMHYQVGYTTTEGIYIDDHLIYCGDCSGPQSAVAVLQDPGINFAVLECARGGILRSGLGFDHCNISIITNVSNDHLGLNDIHHLEQLARVKSVVARSTFKDGYTILNADNDLTYDMRHQVECQVALFAMQETPRIQEHCRKGGWGIYLKDKHIILGKGKQHQLLAHIDEFPITLHGKSECMIENLLPVILAGVLLNFPFETIITALKTFTPTPDNLPGRMNIFDFKKFKVMVDYAHNEAAFEALSKYMQQIESSKKVGIIAATGDRQADDIQKVGYYAANIFDEVIIRHDKNGRGRSNEELTNLLLTGIENSKAKPQVKIISDEKEAIQYAMHHALPGTFIYYFGEDVLDTIHYMQTESQSLFDLPLKEKAVL